MAKREKLFSVTKADFDWQYFRGPGKGGQKRNKTSNAVRCTHRPSGAVGVATDEREQSRNRRVAFERCTGNEKFHRWIKIEVARRVGAVARAEEETAAAMKRTQDFKFDQYDKKKKHWVPYEDNVE